MIYIFVIFFLFLHLFINFYLFFSPLFNSFFRINSKGFICGIPKYLYIYFKNFWCTSILVRLYFYVFNFDFYCSVFVEFFLFLGFFLELLFDLIYYIFYFLFFLFFLNRYISRAQTRAFFCNDLYVSENRTVRLDSEHLVGNEASHIRYLFAEAFFFSYSSSIIYSYLRLLFFRGFVHRFFYFFFYLLFY